MREFFILAKLRTRTGAGVVVTTSTPVANPRALNISFIDQ
jgi:hypothetical protein